MIWKALVAGADGLSRSNPFGRNSGRPVVALVINDLAIWVRTGRESPGFGSKTPVSIPLELTIPVSGAGR